MTCHAAADSGAATATSVPAPAEMGPAGVRASVRPMTFRRGLVLIALLALGLRVGYVAAVQAHEPVVGDAIYYSGQAQAISDGEWYHHPYHPREAADHPPMTALALAPASLLFPDETLAQRLLMCLFGVAVVVGVGLLGRRVGGPRVGLIAAGLAAVYPNLWVNDALMMSETLTALAVVLLLLTTYRFAEAPGARRAAEMGALLGAAMLTRAELALFLPLVLLPVIWLAKAGSWKARVRWAAAAVGVSIAVLSPWMVYNASRFEDPVAISTNDGLTLLGTNCATDYFTPAIGLWHGDCLPPTAFTADQLVDQSVISTAYRAEALSYIRHNLTRLPVVMAVRVGRVWSVYDPDFMVHFMQGEGRPQWVSWLGFAMYVALVPASVAGAVILRRRKVMILPLVATFLIVTITAAAFYGLLRFRIPSEIALVVLAAAAFDRLADRLGGRGQIGGQDPAGLS